MRGFVRLFWGGLAVGLFVVLLAASLAWPLAVLYTLWHFVSKFW